MGRRGRLFLLAAVVALGLPGASRGGTCSSSAGCEDCKTTRTGFSCGLVNYSASCSCEVFVFGGTPACGVDGDCTYTGSGGDTGLGGGGTSGGGGGTCQRSPGQWCPAECQGCSTVYWY